MLEHRAKICRGNFDDIDNAIDRGLINANDIIITTDTHEFIYIREDGSKEIIGNQIKSYQSKDDALIILNALASTHAGQIVTIKNADGNYVPYIVQSVGTKFTVEQITSESEFSGVYWTKI